MTRAVHVPYTVEQDEDGVWCAHAQLRPGVGANGDRQSGARRSLGQEDARTVPPDLCPSGFTLGTRPGRTDGSLCLAAVTSAWLRRRAFNRSAVAIAAGGSSSSWMLSVDRCWKWSRL
jgi:hypothetical protein